MVRGEKKVSSAACPAGKLYLTSTSPKVIFTRSKKFFRKQKKKEPFCSLFSEHFNQQTPTDWCLEFTILKRT